jgi:ribosome-associated protein
VSRSTSSSPAPTGVTADDPVRVWALTAARAAADKNGRETLVLGVAALIGITDAFVITSAANDRAVRTIADEVERAVRAAGGPSPRAVEGLGDARWVLMDFGDFVVHVLLDEARDFYALEGLWGDGEVWAWERPQVAGATVGD